MNGPPRHMALDGLCREVGKDDILVTDWFVPFGFTDPDALLRLASESLRTEPPYDVLKQSDRIALWPLPEGEPDALLVDSRLHGRFAVLAEPGTDIGRLLGLWPVLPGTSQMGVRVEAVLRPPDRLTALIEGEALGYLPVTFHDPFYLGNRGFYGEGRHHDFVLTGLALSFRKAAAPILRIPPDSPGWRSLHEFGGDSGLAADRSIEIHTDRMMVFVPREALAPNAYAIRGPVVAVRRALAIEILGRPLWLVRVRCAEDLAGTRLAEIDIAVTDLVLGDLPPPEPGAYIEAVVLLQGRMCHPDTPRPAEPED